MLHIRAEFFEDWRDIARELVMAEVPPAEIRWIDGRARERDGQTDLFATGNESDSVPAAVRAEPLNVTAAFLATAKTVSHHRRGERWELLYRMLWRLAHGERHLMNIASDEDVLQATQMEKAVRRDAHKMKAFVRFRKVDDEQGEHYIAWHRPDHYSVRYTAGFFSRRFDVMRWTILTPDESVSWDGKRLEFGPGVPRSEAPRADELESLWKTYYAHIFNPARIKLKAMQTEMPKKHWPTMPETELIEQMLREAPSRVEKMVQLTQGLVTAESFVPSDGNLSDLREAAAQCQGCELCHDATQTVFGVGPNDAKLVIIGEQPGDQEDIAGTPFVGPAGEVLRSVCGEVGLDLNAAYVTNAVKHFKFTRSGKRRLHKKPSAREVAACRPWLEAELAAIQPAGILCLGATAASVIFGPNFRLTKHRGVVQETDHAPWTMATYHPSALLRAPDETRKSMTSAFQADLQLAADFQAST